ncbi:MAG: hypothetical protein ACYDER_10960 [Ktedonobacteraceae bacterium]
MDENISNTPQDAGADDRETLLREMIVRLATFPGDPRVSNPRVLVGQIPEGLPEEIPFPEQSRVLGTLIRGPENASIVIDVDQSPAQVLDFYRQRMKAVGWQELELPMPRHGGFEHGSSILAFEARATFCRSSRGPSFTVMAFPRATDENISDVRLELDAGGQCTQQSRMRRMQRPVMHDIIPRLIAPADAQQQGGGGGGSSDNVYSSATLTLDKDVAIVALASHYTTQLERGGWTRIDAGNSAPFAWSTWTFHDEDNEPWLGSFIIFKMPVQQPQYALYVHASIDKGGNQRSGGWFSSSGPMTSI